MTRKKTFLTAVLACSFAFFSGTLSADAGISPLLLQKIDQLELATEKPWQLYSFMRETLRLSVLNTTNFFAGNMFFAPAKTCTMVFESCTACNVSDGSMYLIEQNDGIALKLDDRRNKTMASSVFLQYLKGEFTQLQSFGPGIIKVAQIGMATRGETRKAWERLFAGTPGRQSPYMLPEGPELCLILEASDSIKYIRFQVKSLNAAREYFMKLGIPVSVTDGIMALECAACPGVVFQFEEQ